MKHVLFLRLSMLGLALGGGLLAWIVTRPSASGPVYTVAALQAHLAQEPAAWLNRTIRVQAVVYADGCATWSGDTLPTCLEWQALLFNASADASVHPLALARGPVPSLLAVLRRVPFLHWGTPAPQVVHWETPAPQVVHWETVATYQIQLRAVSCRRGGAPPCAYEALLLDAAPFAA
jgi:hypothetical protein